MSASSTGGASRTYRRSRGTRVLGSGAAVLLVGGAISYMISAGLRPGLLVIGFLALLSLANLVTAWADRFTLSEEGIEYRNTLLVRCGFRPRRLAWDDIVHVREQRRLSDRAGAPRAVFLIPRSGRRLVLDALEDYDEVLRTVRSRCGPTQ